MNLGGECSNSCIWIVLSIAFDCAPCLVPIHTFNLDHPSFCIGKRARLTGNRPITIRSMVKQVSEYRDNRNLSYHSQEIQSITIYRFDPRNPPSACFAKWKTIRSDFVVFLPYRQPTCQDILSSRKSVENPESYCLIIPLDEKTTSYASHTFSRVSWQVISPFMISPGKGSSRWSFSGERASTWANGPVS
jgi:hypothetical protein